MYKLINNQIKDFENPIKTNGGYITNPTNEILLQEGYKPLVENKPTYDNETQYLSFVNYTEDTNFIYANYEVKDIEFKPNEIEQMKQSDTEHEMAITELYEMLLGGV